MCVEKNHEIPRSHPFPGDGQPKVFGNILKSPSFEAMESKTNRQHDTVANEEPQLGLLESIDLRLDDIRDKIRIILNEVYSANNVIMGTSNPWVEAISDPDGCKAMLIGKKIQDTDELTKMLESELNSFLQKLK